MSEHTDWVGSGQIVEANFAAGGGSFGRGRVVSYTDRPTVTIQREDGTRFSWIADLCTTAEAEPVAAVGETRTEFWSYCRAEQHIGHYAYRCIFYDGHDGPHGRLVPQPTWWTGDDAPDRSE
jgi:hypothetical protein